MRRVRGQALVEFALILPIQLMLLVGAFFVYDGMSTRDDLKRAASEGAISGASEPVRPRCTNALEVAVRVLGHEPTAKQCKRTGQIIAVTLTQRFPLAIPFFPRNSWTIVVTERAEVRR